MQEALEAIELGDRHDAITKRAQEIVAELLQDMNLRLFLPDDDHTLVDQINRIRVFLDKTLTNPQFSDMVAALYENAEGTGTGGGITIGLNSFAEVPHSGPAFKALTDALKSATSPSASLKSFTAELIARVVGRLTAYGASSDPRASASRTPAASLQELTGYSLPTGVTASKKPSDYTDLGIAAMKLPDDWVKGVRKRLPVPPDFA